MEISKKELNKLIIEMRNFWETGNKKYLNHRSSLLNKYSKIPGDRTYYAYSFVSDICGYLWCTKNCIDKKEVYKIIESAEIVVRED